MSIGSEDFVYFVGLLSRLKKLLKDFLKFTTVFHLFSIRVQNLMQPTTPVPEGIFALCSSFEKNGYWVE